MHILLMNVPDHNVGKTSSGFHLDAKAIGIFPPIGLLYVAAAVRKQGNHTYEVLDTKLKNYSVDDVMEYIKSAPKKFDMVGMISYTPVFYDVLNLCKRIKETDSSIVTVLGGPHTSLFPSETMTHESIDYLVQGEAENVFPRFCDALAKGESFDDITGIVYRKGDELVFTGEPDYIKDIDSVDMPDIESVDYEKYYSSIGTGFTVGTICSSRGCPYHCTFCCRPYPTYRSRKVDEIVAEMQVYYDKGVREFFFFDDLFNLNAERVNQISQVIIDKGWKIVWAFRARVNTIDEKMLKLAKQAGCRQILYGVEDATDEGLKLIKKNITIAQVKKVVKMTRKAGIQSSTNWIIGFPHHKTKEDILNLIKVAIEVDSDLAQFNICIAYHGTEIFNEGAEKGLYDKDLWREYVKNPVPELREPIANEYLSRDELSELLEKSYKSFYFRPKMIIRSLMRIRSFRELKAHINGALMILFS